MVLACISVKGGLSPPIIVPPDTKVDSEYFQAALENHMQPWVDHKHGGRFTLIMDNAPSHRSKSTASWFARHWPAGGSRHVIYQPPASPDLNPLDYTCWATWARKVPHCASLAELRAKVIGAGLELNQNPDIGRKAISVEFRRRLAACIAAGGDVFE